MSFELIATGIAGCFELDTAIMRDKRGSFVKTFHQAMFEEQGLETQFAEEFYSFSGARVLRGLHFQLPPADHLKIVYCVDGSVLDIVMDLRVGSPSYGKYHACTLSGENARLLYIPTGLAHGFYVTGTHAMMMYKVTTTHSPAHDSGILWNSAGIPWPDEDPVISDRDRALVPLEEFQSPFRFQEGTSL